MGRRLTAVFLARCASLGVEHVELVTAAPDARGTDRAGSFYSSTGWTAMRRERTRDGTTVERFWRRPGHPEDCR